MLNLLFFSDNSSATSSGGGISVGSSVLSTGGSSGLLKVSMSVRVTVSRNSSVSSSGLGDGRGMV
ncbi:MAG: hypothetical protein ACLP5H_26065 [Desulfomonilaceae bacterium]